MGADVDLVQRWLHGRLRNLREWRRGFPERAPDDLLTEDRAGIEALVVAGLLTSADGAAWERRLRAAAAGDEPPPAPPAAVREAAGAYLTELLAGWPEGADAPEALQQRFDGALLVLSAAGAVDAAEWDARRRRRAGWPTAEEERAAELALNEGGTQRTVEAVLPGDGAVSGGRRLLFAVRFGDAIAFWLERDAVGDPAGDDGWDWPDWRLTDDVGTVYRADGESTGGHEEHAAFRPAPPAGARRVELTIETSRFVVAL